MNKEENEYPVYMTIDDAVKYSGLSKWIIYDLQKKGSVKPIINLGGLKLKGYRYTKKMFDELAKEIL